MNHLRNAVFAAAFLGLAGGPAAAQTAAPGSAATPPEKTTPGTTPATNLDSKGGTLSDKLSDTDGVIRPTGNVDPAMHKDAPATGTMPVIKPGAIAPGTAK